MMRWNIRSMGSGSAIAGLRVLDASLSRLAAEVKSCLMLLPARRARPHCRESTFGASPATGAAAAAGDAPQVDSRQCGRALRAGWSIRRSEEHKSELEAHTHLVFRLL